METPPALHVNLSVKDGKVESIEAQCAEVSCSCSADGPDNMHAHAQQGVHPAHGVTDSTEGRRQFCKTLLEHTL